jgi:hypothetical protein
MKKNSLLIVLLTSMAFSLQLKAQEATSLMSGSKRTSLDAELKRKSMNIGGKFLKIYLLKE